MAKIPSKFWAEESRESAHKDIKKDLEKAGKVPKKKSMAKRAKKVGKKAKIFKGKSEKAPKVKSFVEKRMHEFKEGKMHSRVKGTGPKVTNPKQAIAISLSELRAKGAKIPKKKK